MSRLLRQLALFIVSMASSIVVGWLLMDQMERSRRQEQAQLEEIPLPRRDLEHRNGSAPSAPPVAPPAAKATTKTSDAAASTPVAPPKAASTSKPKAAKSDDLTIIEGIGPAYAKALNALGIMTFADLAKQDAEDLANRIQTRITAERIRRDDWIGQAKQLSS